MTTPMHGIVLCAGLGTRLRPLTHVLPKPSVPIGDLPVALWNAEQLLDSGIRSVHVNTHYLAEEVEAQLRAAAHSRSWPAEAIRFWHEPEILETGGGIARIIHQCSQELGHSDYWDTVVVSGDIVASIPLESMLKRWAMRAQDDAALMASVSLTAPRKDVTWVSSDLSQVSGFGADFSPEEAQARNLNPRIFSNHQIISGRVLCRSEVKKCSSIDLFYRSSLTRGEKILHVPMATDADWFDIGTPETYIHCASKLNVQSKQVKAISEGKVILVNHFPGNDNPKIVLPRQSQTNEPPIRHDQSSLMSESPEKWQWLGHIHACPALLRDSISGLIGHIEERFTRPSESQPTEYKLIEGEFLEQRGSESFGQGFTGAKQSAVVGFFDLKYTFHSNEKKELPHPVLVRLTSLMGLNQCGGESGSTHFWILIH